MEMNSGDIGPITGVREFLRQLGVESKKLWYLAGPAIFTAACQYSLGNITQIFSGHITTLALAGFSVENALIAGLSGGIMLGMGSALETLCGQAYGAGKVDMLGVYLQRSWIILTSTAMLLTFLYVFATQFLIVIRQPEDIAKTAGKFALWMIPQLYAYAFNFPMAKFLQAQSKIMAMSVISAVALVFHVLFSWLLMLKLHWGLAGAAVVLNASWWFIIVAQLVYILGGWCGSSWTGFSVTAFHKLWGFVRLSLASAVMVCLECWYFMLLILAAGYLKNAELSVAALSICLNIYAFTIMLAFGMNAAVSVRVSNELGGGHPRGARFSVLVAMMCSFVMGVVIAITLILCREVYPGLFTNDVKVKALVRALTPFLSFSILVNMVQPVLSGVAVGAGWQATIAYVNIGTYYFLGIPLGLLLGFKFQLGVKGIWSGMLSGTALQTLILLGMVYRTNWKKEASIAEQRVAKWGRHAGLDNADDVVGEKEPKMSPS